ncbi:DUF3570 domain-containing protein [Gilvimarinus polysaccharolyticus]|uniref:DUF3570 domain-containing protein n=1 Tax=Gilvimarinus polysaccharolyticus TaxID=863921 RepID=UPI00067340AB|nr:DUF3570 domain-containing protein [Gilvimarinus polysaccharolyticus]
MQLNKTDLKKALFAASCTLLAGNSVAQDWDFDTAIMYYGEADRVQALEGIFQAKKTLKDDKEFSAKLVVDSLTGASANGAVQQATAQTFTTPSGNGQYTANTSETPLDDTFLDTRVQISAQWSQPLAENYVVSTGANVSNEYDYQSIAFNGVLGRYFNNKNTTASLGLSYALDSVDPVGGRPVGLSTMVVDNGQFSDEAAYRSAFDATRQTGGEDGKNTVDVILGLTQVINRQWITQFNVSLSEVDGYLTDPYKVVSEVDASGMATQQRYENRPGSRSKQAFFAQSKYRFESSVWDISYRLTNDDWGINSHTIESRYRFLFDNNSYLEPHIRLYQQGEADFYTPFLREGDAVPEFASADYRIGKLNAYTFGIKYGKKLKSGREYGVRLEYYNQASQDVGVEAPGGLNSLDLYPSLDAVILQFDYKF